MSFYRPYTVKWPVLIQLQHSAYESNLDQMYSVKVGLTLNILLHTHHIFRDCFLPLSAKRLLQCLLQPLVNKSSHSNASGMSDSSPEGVRCLLVLGVFQHLRVSVHYWMGKLYAHLFQRPEFAPVKKRHHKNLQTLWTSVRSNCTTWIISSGSVVTTRNLLCMLHVNLCQHKCMQTV